MSLFNLPKSLAAQTTDVTKMYYDKVHPRTPIEADPARSGSTRLTFTVPGNRFFHPGRSYVRIELELSSSVIGTRQLMDSGESLAMGTASHFFTCATFKIGGTPISRVGNGLAEIDALKTRSTKNQQWLEGIGNISNFWAEDPVQRAQTIYQTAIPGMSARGLQDRFGIIAYNNANANFASSGTGGAPGGALVFGPGNVNTDEIKVARHSVLKTGDVMYGTKAEMVTGVSIPLIASGFDDESTGPLFGITPGANFTPTFVQFSGDKTADVKHASFVSELGGETLNPGLMGQMAPSSTFRNKIELTWQPPLGIFDIDHALPSGEYELELTWDPQWRREIVERFWDAGTLVNVQGTVGGGDGTGVAGANGPVATINRENPVAETLNITVKRVEFHAMMLEGTSYSGDESYVLDLSEWTLTDRVITASDGERRESFDVAPTTDAIAIALQRREYSLKANVVSKSRFIMAPIADTLQDRVIHFRNRHLLRPDLGLKRLVVNYAGQFKPYCDNLMEYKNNDIFTVAGAGGNLNSKSSVNFLTERYVLNTLQNGTYFDSGGPESFEQWLKRGPYYMFLWPKDGSDHDTRAHVTYELPRGTKLNGTAPQRDYSYRLLMFHRHRKGYGISVRNSRVTEIEEAANVAPAVMSS